eukprot:UN05465
MTNYMIGIGLPYINLKLQYSPLTHCNIQIIGQSIHTTLAFV